MTSAITSTTPAPHQRCSRAPRTRRRCSGRAHRPRSSAASGAVAITAAELSRMPLRMSGSASGIWTVRSTRPSVIPMPRADSTVAGSTSRMRGEREREDRRDGQQDERDDHGQVAEPEPDHAEHDHRERRDGPADVRDVGGQHPRPPAPSEQQRRRAPRSRRAIAIAHAHTQSSSEHAVRHAVRTLPVGRVVEPHEELVQARS